MNKRKLKSRLLDDVANSMEPRVYQEPSPAPSAEGEGEVASSDPPADVSAARQADPVAGTPSEEPPLPLALPVPVDSPSSTAPTPVPPAPASAHAGPDAAALEDRLRRLEDVLAAIQTRPTPPPSPMATTSAEMLMNASQRLLPLAAEALQATGTPREKALHFQSAARDTSWLLFDIYAEVRCMVRMYLDPRYQLSWVTRIFPPVLLACMVFSWLTLDGMKLIGPFVDRAVFLILAYLLFRVLGREAVRYRQLSPDLPPSLKL